MSYNFHIVLIVRGFSEMRHGKLKNHQEVLAFKMAAYFDEVNKMGDSYTY